METDKLTQEETNGAVSMLAGLPYYSAVRLTALALLRNEPPEAIQPLLGALADSSPARWREREAAAWALGRAQLTPHDSDAAVSTLLDVLERGERETAWSRAGRALRRAMPTAALCGLGAYGLFCLNELLNRGYVSNAEDLTAPAAFLAILALVMRAMYLLLTEISHSDRVRAMAAASLGHLRAPESMGTLAGALFDISPTVRMAAAGALHEALPALTTEHYGLIGAQSVINLGRTLSYPDNQLAFKVLDALEKVGTSHAIPYVERAMRRKRTARFRDAAGRVLTLLHERQSQDNERYRLLRPAEAPDNLADRLLRPARDSGSYDSQQLLRPASPEE